MEYLVSFTVRFELPLSTCGFVIGQANDNMHVFYECDIVFVSCFIRISFPQVMVLYLN